MEKAAARKEKWLYLDDCCVDRLRMEQALANLADVEIVPAATIAEAIEIVEREDLSLCLLDFHIHKTTSEALIVRIRAEFPNLPIVVVSGHTRHSENIYEAGADAIAPKIMGLESFSEAVQTAVRHAKSIRVLAKSRLQWRQLWLDDRTKSQFRMAVGRRTGHIAIVAGSGMGRSTISRVLAEQIREAEPALFGGKIRSLACGGLSQKQPECFDEMLFGSFDPTSDAPLQKGLLATAEGAVLILDDAHLLPHPTQRRLKTLVENGVLRGNAGQRIDVSKVRIIITAVPPSERESDFIPGFFQSVVTSLIRVPDFDAQATDRQRFLSFLLARSNSNSEHPKMRADASFVRELFDAIDEAPERVTTRGFVKTVEAAIALALSENRTLLAAEDLSEKEFLYDRSSAIGPKTSSLVGESRLITDLLAALNGGTLEAVTQLARRARIERALDQAEGSKVEASRLLGVSRGTLYREIYPTSRPASDVP